MTDLVPSRYEYHEGTDHMTSLEKLVETHLNTWNSPAGAARDQLISATYSPDVFIGEPDSAHEGHAGMEEAISALQGQLPGTALSRSGPIQVAQDLVTYAWTLGPTGQPPIVSGRDVLLVRDNQITSLYVVIDAPSEPPADARS
ncbi:hypothetical protein [Kribbella ginsengisoli]|uniref:Nuclear transport factor 2 family protein n=1 Tax=Kribbella ginsengisoli TaxID=363865 RepID=A0ABP6XKK9_9ACTN